MAVLDHITRAARAAVTPPPGMPRGEGRILVVARIGLPVGTATHYLILYLFWRIGLEPLVWFNLASIALWTWCCWRAFAHREVRLGFILCTMIEIPAHAVLASVYLGQEAGFGLYAIVAAVTTSMATFVPLGWRIAVFAVHGAIFLGAGVYSIVFGPLAAVDPAVVLGFFVLNAVNVWFVIAAILTSYILVIAATERREREEHDRAERLLRSILPHEVAEKLKTGPDVIAEDHPEATILFADIVGFTEASARLSPRQLVDRLNAVFSAFDALSARHGVEKIKTIGDAYMAVAGLPQPRADHAAVIVRLALDMLAAVERLNASAAEPIRIRIGVNTGPVVAGVIGQSKFAYDLWGDAVNVAARMEQTGLAGEVQITGATARRLGEGFAVRPRGVIEVKGKGPLQTYTVTREAAAA